MRLARSAAPGRKGMLGDVLLMFLVLLEKEFDAIVFSPAHARDALSIYAASRSFAVLSSPQCSRETAA